MSQTEPQAAVGALLDQAVTGDSAAWHHLVQTHRERLRRMLALRLDPRLRGRVDPSDLLQETMLEAFGQLSDYHRAPPLPFYLWLRQLAGTRLAKAHRHHLGTLRRDVRREVALPCVTMPEVSSAAMADQLLGREGRPSEALVRAELHDRIMELLEALDPLDREVLALRHYEQLGNGEVARVLDVSEAAASKRYVRALERLRERLGSRLEGWQP
jgi:RNA polymerase sigma-70 factor, ECF subfamily